MRGGELVKPDSPPLILKIKMDSQVGPDEKILTTHGQPISLSNSGWLSFHKIGHKGFPVFHLNDQDRRRTLTKLIELDTT